MWQSSPRYVYQRRNIFESIRILAKCPGQYVKILSLAQDPQNPIPGCFHPGLTPVDDGCTGLHATTSNYLLISNAYKIFLSFMRWLYPSHVQP